MFSRVGAAAASSSPATAVTALASCAAVRSAVVACRAKAHSAPNFRDLLVRQATLREPSPIRALAPLVGLPGMISFGSGMPNPDGFPFTGLSLQLRDGTTLDLSKADLDSALQYSPTQGIPSLVEWINEYNKVEHGMDDGVARDVVVTNGGQEGLTRVFDALLPRGSSILVEDPTYSGALADLFPREVNVQGVPIDGGGIVPEALERTLVEWETHPDTRDAPAPKVIYLIPTGQNPSGSTMDAARKKEIYSLACAHDLVILEDDPYYHLNFAGPTVPKSSMLSMDEQGRVIRFDSMSKVLSSGSRIGWITGPTDLVANVQLHMQSTSLHTSGLSQVIVLSVLREWERQGLDDHLAFVRGMYARKGQAFLAAARQHLTGLAGWVEPTAGMFVWFKLLGIDDSFRLATQEAREAKVLVVPGQAFSPSRSKGPYVRASFSAVGEDQMAEGLARLAKLIQDAQA